MINQTNLHPNQPSQLKVHHNEINSNEMQLFGSIAMQSSDYNQNILMSNHYLYETDKDNESSHNYEDRTLNHFAL